jgi:hypothetical protein
MMYLGHFSYDGYKVEDGFKSPEQGGFTCVVEAKDVDSALDKLHELITAAHGWFSSFQTVDNVFLDDLTEIKQLPTEGVIAHFEHRYDDLGTVSTSLPGVSREFCASYGFGPEPDEDSDDGVEVEPFVSFVEQ